MGDDRYAVRATDAATRASRWETTLPRAVEVTNGRVFDDYLTVERWTTERSSCGVFVIDHARGTQIVATHHDASVLSYVLSGEHLLEVVESPLRVIAHRLADGALAWTSVLPVSDVEVRLQVHDDGRVGVVSASSYRLVDVATGALTDLTPEGTQRVCARARTVVAHVDDTVRVLPNGERLWRPVATPGRGSVMLACADDGRFTAIAIAALPVEGRVGTRVSLPVPIAADEPLRGGGLYVIGPSLEVWAMESALGAVDSLETGEGGFRALGRLGAWLTIDPVRRRVELHEEAGEGAM
ncbi:hypothetical protein [Sandaracinus amylolyticus]|uniref:Uncharacterized protein n=1 Tax=Sandaracinus amylolyticus TaxID=927083 RepID=A0A0F6YNL4_9BACT|nr:hypothetical protein [Sandaracinus amylolyticus]AKF11635.1 hypothetical protein DB32_008784 [Sandaracinus amylolyticus]